MEIWYPQIIWYFWNQKIA